MNQASIQEVLQVVADHFGLSVEDLKRERGNRKVSRARFVAAAVLHGRGMKLRDIGYVLHQHYSTVGYALTRIKYTDPDLVAIRRCLTTGSPALAPHESMWACMQRIERCVEEFRECIERAKAVQKGAAA